MLYSGPGKHTIPGIINATPLMDGLSYSGLREYLSAVLTNGAALQHLCRLHAQIKAAIVLAVMTS